MNKLYQRLFFCCIIFAFIICIPGCNKEPKDSDDDMTNLKTPYDNQIDIDSLQEKEISDINVVLTYPNRIRGAMSVTWDIEHVQSVGLAQIVRYNNGRYYSVDRFTDGRYLFIVYEAKENQSYSMDGFLCSTLADRSQFVVTNGMNREDVIKGDLSSFYVEAEGAASYHRFSDKSIMVVEYTGDNGKYVVSDFAYLSDEYYINVLDYLLPHDLEKILE
ncbi:MAG: hypothetical protein GX815_00900 [Clostridiales bacterium]|nr:hypothetical protein [Clostridiales bacterium]